METALLAIKWPVMHIFGFVGVSSGSGSFDEEKKGGTTRSTSKAAYQSIDFPALYCLPFFDSHSFPNEALEFESTAVAYSGTPRLITTCDHGNGEYSSS